MILLLCSLASAVTIEIGDGSEHTSILEAYPEVYIAGEVTEFVLLPDYDYTKESPFGDAGYLPGLAFGTQVIVRSSVPGDKRASVPVHAYNGATVKLVDLDLQAVSSNYSDPLSAGAGGYSYVPALLATEGAELTVENCQVVNQSFDSRGAGAMAFGATLTLIGSEFSGNTSNGGNENPNELMNYMVGFRENGKSGSFSLTLVDTVIENRSGPAIAVYGEGNSQSLNITGGRIADVTSESAGSAVFTSGIVDTTVSGLLIENAGNTAVKLGQGAHLWKETEIVDASGAQGGAFHLADEGDLVLDQVQCTNCFGDEGGAVFARGGTSVSIVGLTMIGGGGQNGGALYTEGVAIGIKNSRFCAVTADVGPLITTSSKILSLNNVFRNLPASTPIFGGQGGGLEAENNTFVNNEGPILGGVFTDLNFVNNAVVNSSELNSGEQPDNLRLAYNLFYGNVDTDYGPGLEAGVGNLVNVEPGFSQAFQDDPANCAVDPLPAQGSALIDAGDPEIPDLNGTISDIGAFGGPGSEDVEVTPPPTDDSELTLMGGCSGSNGLAAFLLALPLLGLNRKRRQWAEQEQRG